MSVHTEYDLVVVGGGINGTAIARDAAGRGLRVLLCEQDDLAAHTSSASSKLIHGGLRYLEQFAFGLVHKSLRERQRVLAAAPHIARPLRFVVPLDPGQRPAWLIRLGLALYDHLDLQRGAALPASATVDLRRHPAGSALRCDFDRGFEYSDVWVEDARLVVLNALDAAELGADIRVRTRCDGVRREARHWQVELRGAGGGPRSLSTRCLVNATGPWAGAFVQTRVGGVPAPTLRLVKGSHIVVPRLFEHDYAYLLQNTDGRVVFAMPFESRFTLIGTTEVDFSGDPRQVGVADDEVAYLCAAVGRYLRQAPQPADVCWRFAGVRPLLDAQGGSSGLSRDYRLALDTAAAPLLNVLGGKLTTHRALAEAAMDRLAPLLGCDRPAWTGAAARLPGGDSAWNSLDLRLQTGRRQWPWLPEGVLRRYLRTYGTRTQDLIGAATALSELGAHLGDGVYAAELRYLCEREWARDAVDVLWRRTKLGLHVSSATNDAIHAWLQTHMNASADKRSS